MHAPHTKINGNILIFGQHHPSHFNYINNSSSRNGGTKKPLATLKQLTELYAVCEVTLLNGFSGILAKIIINFLRPLPSHSVLLCKYELAPNEMDNVRIHVFILLPRIEYNFMERK